MQFALRLLVVVVLVGIRPVSAASIQLKDGQRINGDIQGQIILKSARVEVKHKMKNYGVVYYLVGQGEVVTSVEETGIRLEPAREVILYLLSWDLESQQEPNETATLKELKASEMRLGSLIGPVHSLVLDSGALVTRLHLKVEKASTVNDFFGAIRRFMTGDNPAVLASPQLASLLGTRVPGPVPGAEVLPHLVVFTPQGGRTIPVDDIVSFK